MIDAGRDKMEEIKREMKGKFIFLKFDCATRIRVNYLGINARFVSQGKGVTRTLAVIDTESQHSADELREMLVTTLSQYEVPLDRVLAGVTDNAANMVKLMADMNNVRILNVFKYLIKGGQTQQSQKRPKRKFWDNFCVFCASILCLSVDLIDRYIV